MHTHTTLNALKSPQSPQQPCSVSLSPKPLSVTPGNWERSPVRGIPLSFSADLVGVLRAECPVLVSQRYSDVSPLFLLDYDGETTQYYCVYLNADSERSGSDTVMLTRPESARLCACVCLHVSGGVCGNDSDFFLFFKKPRRIPRRSKTCGVGRREKEGTEV